MLHTETNHYQSAVSVYTNKLPLVLKSICVGISSGIVVTLYRLLLTKAEELSRLLYQYVAVHKEYLPLLFACLLLLGVLVGYLVRRNRAISGSGIPQVKGILMGSYQAPWLSTLIMKFVGGAVSIFAGLSLGREGPSIQLGACIAQGVSDKMAKSRTEKRILIAGGASAGLAAAFNAPLAGAMFAVEEIFKYISPLILLVTTASAIAADFVSKLVFGMAPVFSFPTPASIPLSAYWLLFLMGILLGCAGTLYNFMLVKTISLYKKADWIKDIWRPVIPFLVAGILAFMFPAALGGGHAMLGELSTSTPIYSLVLMLIIKFIFSMLSFGSGAPGGIFFPLLILGAIIGAIVGNIGTYIGIDPLLFNNFIIVAMAGYFAAIVRAPLTGVVLLLEMTGSFENLLPLLIVSLSAYIIADLLRSKPIYDSLLENLLAGRVQGMRIHTQGKITVELPVHFDSHADGRKVKALGLPRECLLIAIRREGKDIIPCGDTQIAAEDSLIFLIQEMDEEILRSKLEQLTKSE